MKHQLTKTESGYHCNLCNCDWEQQPSSSCPGVPCYPWGTAPKNLKTKSQLQKKRLKPGGPSRGVVTNPWREYDLYDVNEAQPFTAAEIKEINRRIYNRICFRCRESVGRAGWFSEYSLCGTCYWEIQHAALASGNNVKKQVWAELEKLRDRDRDQAIQWARKILSNPEMVLILDTETTGLDEDDEIVQIAVIDLNGETRLESLVKPTHPISIDARRVHDISDEQVADAPTFDLIHSQLTKLTAGKIIVIYNAEFDMRMLLQSARPYGELSELPVQRYDCAMTQYAASSGTWNATYGSYQAQSLPAGDHSARGDCLATLKLIQQMAAATMSAEKPDQFESST